MAGYSVRSRMVLSPTSNPHSVPVSCSCNHIDVPRATLKRNREGVSEEYTVQLCVNKKHFVWLQFLSNTQWTFM
jgi:hypothetical protein